MKPYFNDRIALIIEAIEKKLEFNRHTFADWERIDELPKELEGREIDYPSDSGSQYWFTNKYVYRKSDHWGYNIGTCTWLLDGNGYGTKEIWHIDDDGVPDETYLDRYNQILSVYGRCKWEDFKFGEKTEMKKQAYDGGLSARELSPNDTILVPQDSMYATIYEEFPNEWSWMIGYMGDSLHDYSDDTFSSWEEAVIDFLKKYDDDYGYLFWGAPFLREAHKSERKIGMRKVSGDTPLICKHLLQHINPRQKVVLDGMQLGVYEGTAENAMYGYDGEYASDKLLNGNVYFVEPDGDCLYIGVEMW